jgi:uncharacterized membrane protein YeaQ/YmgE (transglycosylase-associated protein family)
VIAGASTGLPRRPLGRSGRGGHHKTDGRGEIKITAGLVGAPTMTAACHPLRPEGRTVVVLEAFPPKTTGHAVVRTRGQPVGIISWIVLGLIAGVIAKLLVPGKDPGGCIITILLGIAGAFVGGWVGKTLFHVQLGRFFDLRTWGLAILGSLIILTGYRLLVGGRNRD